MEEVIDFDSFNLGGRNCLMLACANGDLERVKYLMSKGGSLDVFDNYGSSCLHLTCFGHHVDVVKYLLNEGMDINQKNKYGSTCFHFTCFGRVTMEVLEMLLNAGSNPNEQDMDGNTAFMYVCWHSDVQAIERMLDAGADWRMKNKGGRTGLDHARRFNKEVVVWLEEYIEKLEISIERCKRATINVLCVGTRKEEMKTLNLNKDVIKIIAKMLWKTRRDVEVWEK